MDLGRMRENYDRATLDPEALDPDPIQQFAHWFDEARRVESGEANAMTLATADLTGQPSARIVLLKEFDGAGFVFYSDYRSRKGQELEQNPRAALCFHWVTLQRQVRVAGSVDRLERDRSARYFHSRPHGSQLGAWASKQSSPLGSRADLEAELRRLSAVYGEGEIPLPSHWGGYLLRPHELEFWQGRPDRLHDRFLYTRTESGWNCARLSP